MLPKRLAIVALTDGGFIIVDRAIPLAFKFATMQEAWNVAFQAWGVAVFVDVKGNE